MHKKKCKDKLKDEYIECCHVDDEYIDASQFESEKLSFKHFLNDQKLPCESIKEGPVFVSEEQAYSVKCIPSQQYFMHFDYETE